MTLEQLKEYILIRNEIEFSYGKKQYSITYWYPDNNEDNVWISFCEFNKETIEVKTVEELWNYSYINGLSIGDMLGNTSPENIYIF